MPKCLHCEEDGPNMYRPGHDSIHLFAVLTRMVTGDSRRKTTIPKMIERVHQLVANEQRIESYRQWIIELKALARQPAKSPSRPPACASAAPRAASSNTIRRSPCELEIAT
jgi:hypothetical protein